MKNRLHRGLAVALFVLAGAAADGADVSGRVKMPELCAASVSPAVVLLDPIDAPTPPEGVVTGDPTFIDQRGMRFEPRVVAVPKGKPVRFGNADSDPHDVHIRAKGLDFNQVAPPGGTVTFIPEAAGVFKVGCDIHGHMRAFIVVGTSPWVMSCGRAGGFRFRDVPDGKYRLVVWHELGETLKRAIEVRGGDVDLGTLVASAGVNPVTAEDRMQICRTGCEPWPMVIDRISMTLAESLDAAGRPGTSARAVPLSEEAYYRDFEGSGMKRAVRLYLGQDRATRIEELFREITATTGVVASGKADPAEVLGPTRKAFLQLARASDELNRKGVKERSLIFARTSPAFWVETTPPASRGRPRVDGTLVTAMREATLIVLREGAPATLALAVLLALLIRPGRAGSVRELCQGTITGVSVGLMAAIGSSLVIADRSGLTLLATAGFLFYVGCGLVAPSGPRTGGEGLFRTPLLAGLAVGFLIARTGFATWVALRPLLANLSHRDAMIVAVTAPAIGLVVLGLFGTWLYLETAKRSPATTARIAGGLFFAIAAAFTGHGVAALQSAGILRTTELAGMGGGLPMLGLYPNWQSLALQGIVIGGAIAGTALLARSWLPGERAIATRTPDGVAH